MSSKTDFNKCVNEHLKTINSLETLYPQINRTIKRLHNCLKTGNKILICGNGGSAADAQHLSAEFLIRLRPMFIVFTCHLNRVWNTHFTDSPYWKPKYV